MRYDTKKETSARRRATTAHKRAQAAADKVYDHLIDEVHARLDYVQVNAADWPNDAETGITLIRDTLDTIEAMLAFRREHG